MSPFFFIFREIFSMVITKEEISAMTLEEKHELLDTLWESLETEVYKDDAPAENEEELCILRERLEEYNTNPSNGVKWEDLKAELVKRNHE
jgi:putative addiction module component (TIGR02574 family)